MALILLNIRHLDYGILFPILLNDQEMRQNSKAMLKVGNHLVLVEAVLFVRYILYRNISVCSFGKHEIYIVLFYSCASLHSIFPSSVHTHEIHHHLSRNSILLVFIVCNYATENKFYCIVLYCIIFLNSGY